MTGVRRHRGFTLLELILATAMVAVLGLSLHSAMSIGFRTRERIADHVTAMREAALVQELVCQDLESALPPNGILAGPFIGYAMGTAGVEADSVEFFAMGRDLRPDGAVAADGIRKVQLLLHADLEKPVLVRRVQRNLLAQIAQEPQEEILSRGVRAFSVRYFDGLGWSAEWDSTLQQNTLPLAVEVSITLDAPAAGDSAQPYRMTRVVPLACGIRAAPAEEETQ